MEILSTIDLLVVVVYLVAIVVFGLWYARGGRDATDYFLAGRTLPWYLIGLSFFASNMSGASFVGLMGAAYDHGMVVFNYEWTATCVLIFFAVLCCPYFCGHDYSLLQPIWKRASIDARAGPIPPLPS